MIKGQCGWLLLSLIILSSHGLPTKCVYVLKLAFSKNTTVNQGQFHIICSSLNYFSKGFISKYSRIPRDEI